MKKLMLLATVFVAFLSQKSNAQVSFDLNISSGPRYVPAYYQPVAYYEPRRVHYAPVRHYYAPPRRVVYVERRGPAHFRNAYSRGPKHVYYRSAPRRVVYTKHYSNRHYRSAPRSYKKVHYKSVSNRHGARGFYRR